MQLMPATQGQLQVIDPFNPINREIPVLTDGVITPGVSQGMLPSRNGDTRHQAVCASSFVAFYLDGSLL